MGRGIAQVAAQSGCEVHLMDTNETQVNGALVSIAKDLNRLVSKGKLGDGESAKILERIRPTRVFGDLAACEYVIEAAVENTELKLQIFRDMDPATECATAGFKDDAFFNFVVPSMSFYGKDAVLSEVTQAKAEGDSNVGRLADGVRWFTFGAWKN